MLGHLHLHTESVSWCSNRTFCVSVCAHCLWFCHKAALRGAYFRGLSTLPSLRELYTLLRSTFSSPCWTGPALSVFIEEMLHPVIHLSDPVVKSLHVLVSPAPDSALQVWPYQSWIKGKDLLPQPPDVLLLMQPRIPSVFFCQRAHCWQMTITVNYYCYYYC